RHRELFQNIQTTEQGSAIGRNESLEPWHTLAALRRWPCSWPLNVEQCRDRRRMQQKVSWSCRTKLRSRWLLQKYSEIPQLRSERQVSNQFLKDFSDSFSRIWVRSNWPANPNIVRACLNCLTRSEEHTSELQSRFDLVCRLLLEKKKKFYYSL